MKLSQQVLFATGLLSFVAALFFIGTGTGDALWRAGVAIMLIDLTCINIWPPKDRTLEG